MNIRRTRIVTGLVLFTYLTTHLLNHSLGLISLDAMEAGREWFLALWRNPYGETVHVTAIGDTVNVASRLQDLTKEYSCQLIVSDEVVAKAGLNTNGFQRHQLTVRNRREALAIFIVENVKRLDMKGGATAVALTL
jgi:hypothetical protein